MTWKPVCLVGRTTTGHATGERDRLGVRRPVRRRDEHLVARVEQGGERREHGVLAAVGHQHLAGGALDSPSRGGLGGDGLAQLGQAGGGRVLVVARVLAGRDGGARRCGAGVGKSGSPAPKPMTSSPAALQGLGLGVDGQRGRLGDARRDALAEIASSRAARLLAQCRPATVDPPDRTPDIRIPARPAAGRRPLRVRPVQGPTRSARRPAAESGRVPRHVSHRQAPVKYARRRGARRAERAVRPARRLGDRARQRRHHRLLGRRHVRPHRAAQPAPGVRRVLVEVRRGRRAPPRTSTIPWSSQRRRAPIRRSSADDGVDVYALTHNETSTGVMMALAGPAGADRRAARRRRRHLRRRRAARGTRPRSTSTTSPRRSASPPTAGLWVAALLAGRGRAHRAHRRVRPLDRRPRSTSASPSTTAGSTRPTTRRRWPRWCCSTHQLEWMLAGGGLDWWRRRCRTSADDPLRVGRVDRLRARRSSTDPAERSTWSARSTSTTPSTPTTVSAALRANGIVDTEPYRKLGRNQLRIGMFPAVDPTTWRR